MKSSDHDDTQLLALVEGFRKDQGPLFNERWTRGQAYRQAIPAKRQPAAQILSKPGECFMVRCSACYMVRRRADAQVQPPLKERHDARQRRNDHLS
jgi:hypothetical protein